MLPGALPRVRFPYSLAHTRMEISSLVQSVWNEQCVKFNDDLSSMMFQLVMNDDDDDDDGDGDDDDAL